MPMVDADAGMPRRSALFSPGDQRDKLEGALESAADAVIFDLEDGVAPGGKERAREIIAEVLADLDAPGVEVLVRLNSLHESGQVDIDALAEVGTASIPAGYVLPKVATPADARHVLTRLRQAGLATSLWCLLESPSGIFEARQIAAVDGVDALIFGGEDYATAVGATRTEPGTEVLVPRQLVVMAAAAADIDAIDGISTSLEDMDRVAAEAREANRWGFDGKLAIHPAQLGVINQAFTPTPEEVDWAKRVLNAADEHDQGVFRVDDAMIDAPLIERARSIIERSDIEVDD